MTDVTKPGTWKLLALVAFPMLAACPSPQPDPTPTPAVDSTALRARADSIARADSLARARADSLARARADSIARAAQAARPDSVRAEIQRDSVISGGIGSTGLPAAEDQLFGMPLYFETDRSDLTTESRALLDNKIDLFRRYPRLMAQIEGHADERGPDEYNLALGNRRAAMVKRYMVERGIADERVSIVSYGEERPAVAGSSEDAWSRNRRAEFRATRGIR